MYVHPPRFITTVYILVRQIRVMLYEYKDDSNSARRYSVTTAGVVSNGLRGQNVRLMMSGLPDDDPCGIVSTRGFRTRLGGYNLTSNRKTWFPGAQKCRRGCLRAHKADTLVQCTRTRVGERSRRWTTWKRGSARRVWTGTCGRNVHRSCVRDTPQDHKSSDTLETTNRHGRVFFFFLSSSVWRPGQYERALTKNKSIAYIYLLGKIKNNNNNNNKI